MEMHKTFFILSFLHFWNFYIINHFSNPNETNEFNIFRKVKTNLYFPKKVLQALKHFGFLRFRRPKISTSSKTSKTQNSKHSKQQNAFN